MNEIQNKLEQMCHGECLQSVGKLIMMMEPLIRDKTNETLDGSAVWEYLCVTGNLVKGEKSYGVTALGYHNGFIRTFRHDHEGNAHPIIVCRPEEQQYLVECVCEILADYKNEKG